MRTKNPLLLLLTAVGFAVILMGASSSGTNPLNADPAKALNQLLNGNKRYVGNKTLCPNPSQRPSDAPQHPIAAILSCSDSRVPPELLFDQGVGSLFVVRVAGNTYDRLGIESLEYAVNSLGTRLLIVLGHDNCGAVSAAVKSYPDKAAGPMRANIYPAVRKAQQMKGDLFGNAVNENAILTAQRLSQVPEFSRLVRSGEISIVPARYNLATGAVEILRIRNSE